MMGNRIEWTRGLLGAVLWMVCALPLLLPAIGTAADNATPTLHVTGLEVLDTGRGSRISITADGPFTYQTFKLANPHRLLLTFPGAALDPTIQPRALNLATITGLYPQDAEGGARLEVTLRQESEFDAQMNGNRLDVVVLSQQQADPNRPEIQDLSIQKSSAGTTIRLVANGVIPDPQVFRLNDPPRLVVDMFGVASSSLSRSYPVDSPEANSVRLGSGAGKTRLVVDLAAANVTFRVDQDQGVPVIQLSYGAIGAGDRPALEDVTFQQEQGEAIVRIRLNRSDVGMESHQEGNDLIIMLAGAKVPTTLERRLDVQDFGTPINAIDTFQQEEDGRLVIRMADATARHKILQKDAEIIVKVTPPSLAGAEGEQIYSGEKITLDFKDIDIQNALKLIAEISNLNVITSDSVSGSLTMRLVDVPWDQALDLMLEAKGLGKIQQGNVLRVAPLAEIQAMNQQRRQAQESLLQAEPLITEMIPINFAQASEVSQLLQSGGGEGGGSAATSLLSSRGSVSIDNRTNTLIVRDTPSSLVRIKEMVKRLDSPVQQVLIEGRVVTIETTAQENLGINWGFNFKNRTNSRLGISNSAENAYTVYNTTPAGSVAPRASMTGAAPSFNVNLMPASTAGQIGMHLGTVAPFLDLDIELGALEQSGKSKTISNPRVLTINNQAASISQGVNIPYAGEASSGGVTTEYVSANLSLDVTPQITPDNFITLQVAVTNNTPTDGNPPSINTQQLTTRVLLKNGETVVLGGIYQGTQTDGSTGVPGVSHIPLFGWLFKNKSVSETQRELLIFLTPRVVNAQ